MGMNRVPIDKSMTKQKAVSQGGYYNTDGDWNCIITLDEYPDKILRGRVDVLVIKDGKLFMLKKDNGKYRIPGGGFDREVLNSDQAFIETKEEAKLIISNIRYTGVTYIEMYDEVWHMHKDDIPYDGTYNEVYIADYKGRYEGYIRKGLSDMELTNKGDFYDINEIKDILKKPHKQALENMLHLSTALMESAVINEFVKCVNSLRKDINKLHRENKFNCLNPISIEECSNGLLFMEYNIESNKDLKEFKQFLEYSNYIIKTSSYTGYIQESGSLKGHGYLYAKPE